MKVKTTKLPGRGGTRRETSKYGPRLVKVRWRLINGRLRKTVELWETDSPLTL